jgi:hypothetical protein
VRPSLVGPEFDPMGPGPTAWSGSGRSSPSRAPAASLRDGLRPPWTAPLAPKGTAAVGRPRRCVGEPADQRFEVGRSKESHHGGVTAGARLGYKSRSCGIGCCEVDGGGSQYVLGEVHVGYVFRVWTQVMITNLTSACVSGASNGVAGATVVRSRLRHAARMASYACQSQCVGLRICAGGRRWRAGRRRAASCRAEARVEQAHA